MKQAKAAVDNFFRQVFAGVHLAKYAYERLGDLVFSAIISILSIVRDLCLGVLDVVDNLVTGTYRSVIPKKE